MSTIGIIKNFISINWKNIYFTVSIKISTIEWIFAIKEGHYPKTPIRLNLPEKLYIYNKNNNHNKTSLLKMCLKFTISFTTITLKV